ncbi:hypothetical protein [Fluviispira multicolorata]|uniref:Type II secretion system protein GspN n=1 Tax=Fluviispira multicolorata TaxID=2654512 RepID=A0A833JA85_9BACT|nr:hypothetical protein [Fluviispira multicolorata]KAB8027404.1 hypothetical protein GCL57_14505 [Fluviispira multicolorata]
MNKKKLIKIITFGVFFFLILLYKTFPYDLIKDNLSRKINLAIQKEKIPLVVKIGDIKPYWVTGLELNDVEVKNILDDSPPFILNNVIVKLSVLPFIIGRISIDLKALQTGGTLYTSASISLIDALSGIVTLKYLDVFLTNFPLNTIFSQFLSVIKSSNKTEFAVLTPVISKTTMGGNLNGKIKFRENYANIRLTLDKAYLNIQNETLNIPKQDFSKAAVNIKWDSKRFYLDKEIELKTQNVSINVGGFWETFPDPTKPTQISLDLKINLSGVIEKDFGFLIPQFLNCSPNILINGNMNVSLVGEANNFTCH